MIRILILLSPVYVCLFWIITYQSNKKNLSSPAKFLTFFLLIGVFCFFGQFIFFAPYPDIFPYWEPINVVFGTLAFPLYYIYFRLLTVDDKFSFRNHAKYLIVPVLISIVYLVGILLTPFDQYKAWLYNETLFPDSPYVQFLGIMRKTVIWSFIAFLVLTYILNWLLLKKYAHKAEEYYSDINDGEYNNAKMLNYYLIIITVSMFVAHIIGRTFLFPHDTTLNIIWLIFSIALYGIGYMGFKQKAINPTFELEEKAAIIPFGTELNLSQQIILAKLKTEFEKEKIYLNSTLNINDVVQKIGTNRTYISSIINQQYNQNFCCFVNNYRYLELVRLVTLNPERSFDSLVECCGFGSLSSLKRVVFAQTGLSLQEWKQLQLKTA